MLLHTYHLVLLFMAEHAIVEQNSLSRVRAHPKKPNHPHVHPSRPALRVVVVIRNIFVIYVVDLHHRHSRVDVWLYPMCVLCRGFQPGVHLDRSGFIEMKYYVCVHTSVRSMRRRILTLVELTSHAILCDSKRIYGIYYGTYTQLNSRLTRA